MKPSIHKFRVKIFHGLKMESKDYPAPDSCSALIDALEDFTKQFGPGEKPESYKVTVELLMSGGDDEDFAKENRSDADQNLADFDRTEAREINSAR